MAFARAVAFVFAALLVCGNVASARNTPLSKAIEMIEQLRAKVASEGEAEAKTYDKFACACKDGTSSKLAAISTGQTEKDTAQAQINSAMVARDAQDQAIDDAVQGIGQTNAEIKQLHAQRQNERLQYEKNEVDLTGAIQALSSAIHALQSAKTAVTSLAELRATGQVDVVKRALEMAEMLSVGTAQKRVSSSLLALQVGRRNQFDPPSTQYDFHADDILSTLEQLKTDFRAQKGELSTQETSAIATFDQLVQDKESIISQHNDALEAAKKSKAEQVSFIATGSQDLTTTAAQLLDDQKYLTQISESCNKKAVLWDQRKNLRADELQGLTKTLEVLKALDQRASFLTMRQRSRAHWNPTSLLQLNASTFKHATARPHVQRTSVPRTGPRFGRRARALELLRSRAQSLKSAYLVRLVDEASASDPLAKVKTMIQELVERLLKEAENEANHKGWCDKEVALAEQKRDTSAANIADSNAQLALLEAQRAKLTEKIGELGMEIADLESLGNMTAEQRAEEKLENEAVIQEAKEGKAAIEEAMRILNEFYGAAANAEVSLLGVGASPAPAVPHVDYEPLPDAGFDDVYVGAQGSATGAVAMLEVLRSDFERTATETAQAEMEAEQDFLKMQTANGASLAEKRVVLTDRHSQLSSADADDNEHRIQMKSEQDTLDKALSELNALVPACSGGGMTAEERKLKREEEMSALKQALCILDNHGGSTAGC